MDSSWHSFTSEGGDTTMKSNMSLSKHLQTVLSLQMWTKLFFFFFFFFFFNISYPGTYQCTQEGCCHSRSPADSSTRSPAACSHSDPSYRFHQRTKNTRRYLQTRKEKYILSDRRGELGEVFPQCNEDSSCVWPQVWRTLLKKRSLARYQWLEEVKPRQNYLRSKSSLAN